MDKVLEFTVNEDGELLKCVREQLVGTPTGKTKSYLEHRQISVEGVVTTRYDYPVKKGQTVRIALNAAARPKRSPMPVVYEDEYLLAVNKPSGLLCVASDADSENTAFRLLKDAGIYPIYVVHRLDKDTSGVLLFAKTAQLRQQLQENWGNVIRREYLAVCEGVFKEKRGRCDTVLAETSTHRVYSAENVQGKRAVTNFEVIKENRRYSMVRVLIETGRKNQIRAHMRELRHPVVGDKKYGARTNPLKRLGLHAAVLEIPHPVTGEALAIRAPADHGFKLPAETTK